MLLYILWLGLVITSLLGWGICFSHLLRIHTPLNQASNYFVLGLATLSFFGAILILLGFGGPLSWIALLSTGSFLFFIFHMIAVIMKRNMKILYARNRWLISAGSFLTVMFFAVTLGAIRNWNPCDDDPAYLYLARRLWEIGDLNEQFNNRRLTSPGFFTFIQAMVMGPFKEGTLNFADEILGALLLLLTFWRHRHTKQIFPVGVLLTLIITVSHQYFANGNSSPTFLMFSLLVACVPALSDESIENHLIRSRALLFGLGMALVVVSRPFYLLVTSLIFISLIVSFKPYRRLRFILFSLLSALVVFVPWAMLGLRDVDTPLFPLFKGNLASNFPFDGYLNNVDIGSHVLQSIQEIASSVWPLSAVFIVVTYVALRRESSDFARETNKVLRFFYLLMASSFVFYIYFAISTRRTGAASFFPRFWAPFFALSSVVLVKKIAEIRTPIKFSRSVISLMAPLLIFFPTVNGIWTNTSTAVRVITSGHLEKTISKGRYPLEEAIYLKISDAIPNNSRVLLAVQLPHLLLSNRYQTQSIDYPGSTVKNSNFPFFQSYETKKRWIKKNRFTHVVITSGSSSSCLFGLPSWNTNVGKDNAYEDWSVFVKDWISFSDLLINEYSTSELKSGDEVLIDVKGF